MEILIIALVLSVIGMIYFVIDMLLLRQSQDGMLSMVMQHN